ARGGKAARLAAEPCAYPPRAQRLALESLPQFFEYAFEHRSRQLAGVRVVARAVIAVGQKLAVWQHVKRAMFEGESRFPLTDRRQHGAMRDLTESEDRAQPWHRRDLGDQELAAGADFVRQRLIFGWHAACGVADAAIDEDKSVILVLGVIA